MLNEVLHLFQEYMGSGLILIWFLVAVVYLLLTEKRKHIRVMFVYVPLMLLAIFFNPLFAKIFYEFAGDEIYYRILWLIPITVVIAFAAVEVCSKLQGIKRTAFGVVAAIVIVVSGSYIYSNPYFRKAENLYHVPQSVVDICDVIEVEGREVKAVFPIELVQYVRQYSPVVCMPYGREVLVEKWSYQRHDMVSVMEAEVVDVELLTALCRENWCHYVVISEDKALNGNFEDYAFEVFTKMHGYVIYKDSTVDLTEII